MSKRIEVTEEDIAFAETAAKDAARHHRAVANAWTLTEAVTDYMQPLLFGAGVVAERLGHPAGAPLIMASLILFCTYWPIHNAAKRSRSQFVDRVKNDAARAWVAYRRERNREAAQR